jgi:hypothetical protein
MFNKPYFVMLWNQHGTALIPMMMDDYGTEKLAMFSTVDKAVEAARATAIGEAFGFDVFEAGNGVEGQDPL